MTGYFDYHYDGPAFELFGAGHLISLALVAAVVGFLIWGWRDPGPAARRRARLCLVAVFLLIETSWHAWNLANGAWNIQQHLPLHTCSLSAWCAIYMLLTRSYRVYEIIFFIGIAGAGQTLLTPDAGIYGLPHFRALQTLAGHGMVVIALVYMTTIEGFRPTRASIWRAMAAGNVYVVFVTGINLLIGSNYMYTLQKPATASLLDLMGPWPWYLIAGEFVALLLFSMLYLPFMLYNRRRQRQPVASPQL